MYVCRLFQTTIYYLSPFSIVAATMHALTVHHVSSDVVLHRTTASEYFGFTIRGSYPAFVLTVDPNHLAHREGVHVGDHILSVNRKGMVWCGTVHPTRIYVLYWLRRGLHTPH